MCIHIHVYTCTYVCSIVIITRPPQTKTVCRGSEVTIRCGYSCVTALPVTWIINGTSFTQQEVVDSSLYRLNDLTTPDRLSLTVLSFNDNTTFQCIVHSTPHTTSTIGRVIVAGMHKHVTTYIATYVQVYAYVYVSRKINKWAQPFLLPDIIVTYTNRLRK